MVKNPDNELTRRERQIMTLLYKRGTLSVADIAKGLPNSQTDTAVRTFLSILEEKGYVKRRKDGRRFLYEPKQARGRAARQALRQVLNTFFGGSMSDAFAAHLSDPKGKVDKADVERLLETIEDSAKEGKR